MHYYVSEFGPSGATLCGLGIEDDLSTTDVSGKATCGACRLAADEEPLSTPQVFEVPQPPPGVTRVTDADGDLWMRRGSEDLWETGAGGGSWAYTLTYGPLTDATPGREVQPPTPLVLRLPEVPEGTVALIGNSSGLRWTPYGHGGWQNNGNVDTDEWAEGTFAEVLAIEHPHGVTPEFAPPREPRTWPKLENSISDLPDVIEVHLSGTWKRRAGSTLFEQGETWRTLAQLRELGDVTEVLS